MRFVKSIEESDIFGLHFGRAPRIISTVTDSILEDIFQQQFDVIKFKMRVSQSDCLSKIQGFGVPFNLFSVLLRHEKKVSLDDGSYHLPEGISYERYNGTQREVFSKIIRDGHNAPTGLTFDHPLFDALLPKQKQIDAAVNYFLSYGFVERNSNRFAWLLKVNDTYAGAFMGLLSDNLFEGTWYTVLPEFRGVGLGKVIYKVLNRICFENGWKGFGYEVQIQNVSSLKSTFSLGSWMPSEPLFHMCLTPLLSLAGQSNDERIISADYLKGLRANIRKISTLFPDLQPKGFYLSEFQATPFLDGIFNGTYRLCLSTSKQTEIDIWKVLKVIDPSERIIGARYFHYKSR